MTRLVDRAHAHSPAVAAFVGKTRLIDNVVIQPARERRATGALTG